MKSLIQTAIEIDERVGVKYRPPFGFAADDCFDAFIFRLKLMLQWYMREEMFQISKEWDGSLNIVEITMTKISRRQKNESQNLSIGTGVNTMLH